MAVRMPSAFSLLRPTLTLAVLATTVAVTAGDRPPPPSSTCKATLDEATIRAMTARLV